MRAYISPRTEVVAVAPQTLLVGSGDEVEFRFTTSVNDDWEVNEEYNME